MAGGVLTLAGGASAEWFRDRRVLSREVRTRMEASQERHNDFQHQTLIELQDALQSFVRGIGRAVHFDFMAAKEHDGKQFQLPDGVSDDIFNAQVLTTKLSSRVDDDEVRSAVSRVIELGMDATAIEVTGPTEIASEMGKIATVAQERMGALIRSL